MEPPREPTHYKYAERILKVTRNTREQSGTAVAITGRIPRTSFPTVWVQVPANTPQFSAKAALYPL
jgi:hypothetical protein